MNHWITFMRPVDRRYSLGLVAQWWAETFAWRSKEIVEGRGNPYDMDLGGRVPRSTVRLKYPWLTLEDEIDLPQLILVEARNRSRGTGEVAKAFRAILRDGRRRNLRVKS